MRITRIHTTQQLSSNKTFALETESSHHLARVLRLGVGDALTLFDGRGGEYPSEIIAIDKKHVTVRAGVQQLREGESPLAMHLGIAISRGERMDWIVQQRELSLETPLGAFREAVTELTAEVRSSDKPGGDYPIALYFHPELGLLDATLIQEIFTNVTTLNAFQ